MDLSDAHQRAVFFEVYEGLPRGGPGSTASTRRALELAHPVPERARVLDLGCGPGAQTVALAKALPKALIRAVELHQPFLDNLQRRLAERGLTDRVELICGDMAGLDVPAGSVDLVWCEGAAYFIGVATALEQWRRWLRPGGTFALTEATWLRPDPPQPVRRCWQEEYPDIGTVEALLDTVTGCGYELCGSFVLPPSDWWDTFYTPMTERIALLRERYRRSAVARAVLSECADEIELYRQYGDLYGYTFVVGRRR
jgi:ubiquinone/menaquinone biosynthesis C-methylase UbiE